MKSLKDYPSEKPAIPPVLSFIVMIAGAALCCFAEDIFYKTFIPGYVIILILIITGLVLATLLYKLQSGKNTMQLKYFMLLFVMDGVGIGGMIVYLLLTTNYNKAGNEKTVPLPIISRGVWKEKTAKKNYIEVSYEGQSTALTVSKLPPASVKYVTAQLKDGYFGLEVIEGFKLQE